MDSAQRQRIIDIIKSLRQTHDELITLCNEGVSELYIDSKMVESVTDSLSGKLDLT